MHGIRRGVALPGVHDIKMSVAWDLISNMLICKHNQSTYSRNEFIVKVCPHTKRVINEGHEPAIRYVSHRDFAFIISNLQNVINEIS